MSLVEVFLTFLAVGGGFQDIVVIFVSRGVSLIVSRVDDVVWRTENVFRLYEVSTL